MNTDPDTWTRGPLPSDEREAADLTAKHLMADYPIPLVLTVDGETAVPVADLGTPASSYLASLAVERAGHTPDGPVAYEFTREGEVVAAGFIAREPEAGS
jgi:hypothetical protein